MAQEDVKRVDLVKLKHSGEVVEQFIPTSTVKKAFINNTQDASSLRASSIPTQGKVLALTRLHLAAAANTSFALVDRNGTIDQFEMGTVVGVARTDVLLQGDYNKPITVAEGTFSVYSGPGSQSGSTRGSFVIAYEGVRL